MAVTTQMTEEFALVADRLLLGRDLQPFVQMEIGSFGISERLPTLREEFPEPDLARGVRR